MGPVAAPGSSRPAMVRPQQPAATLMLRWPRCSPSGWLGVCVRSCLRPGPLGWAEMVRSRWFRERRKSLWPGRPKLPLRSAMRVAVLRAGRARWLYLSWARWAAYPSVRNCGGGAVRAAAVAGRGPSLPACVTRHRPPAHLALLLQLLGGPAHDVDLHGGQADGAVDHHVLGGAVGRVRAQVQLRARPVWARARPGPASPARPAPLPGTHLGDEQLQEVGLVPQRVMHEAVAEGHHAVGEVVLGQPRHHPLLLHVRPARHVNDEVAQVLPVPAGEGQAWVSHSSPTPFLGHPPPCPASPYGGRRKGSL